MSMAKGIFSRLKIMAGLNIAERRLPQDGRARLACRPRDRPARRHHADMHGESVVMRAPRQGAERRLDFDDSGFGARASSRLRRGLHAPHGMLHRHRPDRLAARPRRSTPRSPSSTTPTRKILTVEDPVEYQIPGINQTQVQPDDRPDLRRGAALVPAPGPGRDHGRRDPRPRDRPDRRAGGADRPLVLSTLHTNTAAGAVTRLLDMGVEGFLLASSVRAIVGQRLVRILCEHCKKPHA